jgi:hypothetical protein
MDSRLREHDNVCRLHKMRHYPKTACCTEAGTALAWHREPRTIRVYVEHHMSTNGCRLPGSGTLSEPCVPYHSACHKVPW